MYSGDLCGGDDVRLAVEREHLRAQHLTVLARLADHHYGRADYSGALDYASRLLSIDPCREDAHRLAMRCYVSRGERAQAMRQYRLCERVLHAEFGVAPEPATVALYDQIRLAAVDEATKHLGEKSAEYQSRLSEVSVRYLHLLIGGHPRL